MTLIDNFRDEGASTDRFYLNCDCPAPDIDVSDCCEKCCEHPSAAVRYGKCHACHTDVKNSDIDRQVPYA